MAKKRAATAAYKTIFIDVARQDMSLSSHQDSKDEDPHFSVLFSGTAQDGAFESQEIVFQISRHVPLEGGSKSYGSLIQSKPQPAFVVMAGPEKFAHIVTLIAAKAIKEIY